MALQNKLGLTDEIKPHFCCHTCKKRVRQFVLYKKEYHL